MSPDHQEITTAVAGTRHRAIVAKVLRDRHPGNQLRDYIQDAAAILLALDEDDNIAEHHKQGVVDFAAEAEATPPAHDKVIRADALNSAARLLASAVERLADETEEGDLTLRAIAHTWITLAQTGEAYIHTGYTEQVDGEDQQDDPMPL